VSPFDAPVAPVRSLRWLECRWFATLHRARSTGALALSLGVPQDAEFAYPQTWIARPPRALTDVANDLGLSVSATRGAGLALVGRLDR
jgi:hypothetical protein